MRIAIKEDGIGRDNLIHPGPPRLWLPDPEDVEIEEQIEDEREHESGSPLALTCSAEFDPAGEFDGSVLFTLFVTGLLFMLAVTLAFWLTH